MMKVVFQCKDGYKTDIKKIQDFDKIVYELQNIEECILDENLKEDISTAKKLLWYARCNDSQEAFDRGYEIAETLNAYLFNYPLTQEYFDFDGSMYNIDVSEVNQYFPVTKAFGYEYSESVEDMLSKTTEPKMQGRLSDKIQTRNNILDREIEDIKKSGDLNLVISKLQSASEKVHTLYQKTIYNDNTSSLDDIYADAVSDISALIDALPETPYYGFDDEIKNVYNFLKTVDTNKDIVDKSGYGNTKSDGILTCYRILDELQYVINTSTDEWINENKPFFGVTNMLGDCYYDALSSPEDRPSNVDAPLELISDFWDPYVSVTESGEPTYTYTIDTDGKYVQTMYISLCEGEIRDIGIYMSDGTLLNKTDVLKSGESLEIKFGTDKNAFSISDFGIEYTDKDGKTQFYGVGYSVHGELIMIPLLMNEQQTFGYGE